MGSKRNLVLTTLHHSTTPLLQLNANLKHPLRLRGLSQFEVLHNSRLILRFEGLVYFLNGIGAQKFQ